MRNTVNINSMFKNFKFFLCLFLLLFSLKISKNNQATIPLYFYLINLYLNFLETSS